MIFLAAVTPNSEELNPKFLFLCSIIAVNKSITLKTHLTVLLLSHKAYCLNKEKASQLHKPGIATKNSCTLKTEMCAAFILTSIPSALMHRAPCSHSLTYRPNSQGTGAHGVCTLLTKFALLESDSSRLVHATLTRNAEHSGARDGNTQALGIR